MILGTSPPPETLARPAEDHLVVVREAAAPPPALPADRPLDDAPRRLTDRTLDDTLSLVGAGIGSLALTWLLYEQLLPTSGKLGFVVVWFLMFLALFAVVTSISNSPTIVVDRTMMAVVYGAAGVVMIILAAVVVYTLAQGWSALTHANFYIHDNKGVGTNAELNHGGILHAIIGSGIEVGIATAISLPLGLTTAVYISEVGGKLARYVRIVIEAMTGLPEIVAGLFVYATLVVGLGLHKSGFPAAIAIGIMMVPIIARSAEVVLRVVPGGLRQAGLALGAPAWRTVWGVVLPTARKGLATALILGIARGVGETAPVILVSGVQSVIVANPFQQPMSSLPLYIYFAVRSGQPNDIARGFGCAAVLLILVVALFLATRLLARDRTARR